RGGLGSAKLAIHAAVFPLDRERASVADPRQRAEDRPPLDAAMAGRDKIPAAARVAEVQMRAKNAGATIQVAPAFLDMHVIDPIGEGFEKRNRVDELVIQVAWVEVDPKRRPATDRRQRLLGGGNIVGDLGWV